MSTPIRIAVMQPYFFPYIGYFQLVNACDDFVFLDNVQYIERGWINRNRLLVNGRVSYVTVPVVRSSQKTLVLEKLIHPSMSVEKLLHKIRNEYKKCQYFPVVYDLLVEIFRDMGDRISALSASSVTRVSRYVGLNTRFHLASELIPNALSASLTAEDRIILLVHALHGSYYINMRGGEGLYNSERFDKEKIKLSFIDPSISPYPQSGDVFVQGLSIIDMLMNLPAGEVRKQCELSR